MPHAFLTRLAAPAAALTLLAGGALAPAASARAAKAPAPSLKIESKNCAIGATEAERSVTLTALAMLGSTGERVTMRFTVQARQGKAKWKSLLPKNPADAKVWETTDAAGAGLKLTKTIPALVEGTQYRVLVEARSIDERSKVVTKTSRRSVACTQPLFTPTLVLAKTAPVSKAGGSGEPLEHGGVGVTIRNLGRLAAPDAVVTVASADTRVTIATAPVAALKGNGSSNVVVPLPAACTGELYVTVQPKDATAAELTVDQAATVPCPSASADGAAKSRRR